MHIADIIKELLEANAEYDAMHNASRDERMMQQDKMEANERRLRLAKDAFDAYVIDLMPETGGGPCQ